MNTTPPNLDTVTVEFFGLPGSGKSLLAAKVCDELRREGIDAVFESWPARLNESGFTRFTFAALRSVGVVSAVGGRRLGALERAGKIYAGLAALSDPPAVPRSAPAAPAAASPAASPAAGGAQGAMRFLEEGPLQWLLMTHWRTDPPAALLDKARAVYTAADVVVVEVQASAALRAQRGRSRSKRKARERGLPLRLYKRLRQRVVEAGTKRGSADPNLEQYYGTLRDAFGTSASWITVQNDATPEECAARILAELRSAVEERREREAR